MSIDSFGISIENLYKEHARALYLVALALSSNEALAEDAVQEVFLKLWERNDDLGLVNDPFAYLATMVRHRVIDALKHEKVIRIHEERITYELESLLQNCGDDDIETIEVLKVRAKAMVDSLPPKAREVFLKAVVEGLSYKQIASDLNISVNTVKTELLLARKKIEEKAKKWDFFILILLMSYNKL